MKPKVKFTNVSKSYVFYKKQYHKLLDLLLLKKNTKNFYALNDVSFEVMPGESIGVIGINGSGKSTLSNLLAQVVQPTQGNVEIDGDPSLIAISAGLNNNLSGMENIELKCLMLGVNKEEIKRRIPEIIEFADIGDFINQPVKNYSSGMKSRLGFAISVHTNPDLLIIDEALSVGDSTFYEKCLVKINEFKKQGKTIFFISHSVSQIRSFSDRVMWLHFGQLKQFGDKKEVLDNYKEFIGWFNELSDVEKKKYRNNMLEEQFTYIQAARSRKEVKKNQKPTFGKKIFRLITVLVLLMIFSFAVLQMFDIKPFDSLKGQLSKITINNEMEEHTENNIPKELVIGEKGKVSSRDSDLYKGIDSEEEPLAKLAFGTEIFVNKEVGNMYNISYKGNNYYISKASVKLESALDDKVTDLQKILEISPDSFTNSYSYFLAYLEMNYSEVKEGLLGLTGEIEDSEGNKILEYDYDNLSYHFNEMDQPDYLIIEGINQDRENIQTILDQAYLKNEKEGLYYLKTNDYKIKIDLQLDRITLYK
ncbi:teichoic acids export ABC transporter ATP-binding subunit TagH [Rossellomorea vietnamensis]|uniref:teichoic acids export ABC transporter ATP-binding subunit TagH n=1 Tax=Rossellomorea vietnamensis TaxID=218284 RepID=UPI003D2C0304